MTWLIALLVCCLVVMNAGLLVFIAWRETQHRAQLDDLTSKLMARSLTDYSLAKQTEKTEPKPAPEKTKKVVDPTLGSDF